MTGLWARLDGTDEPAVGVPGGLAGTPLAQPPSQRSAAWLDMGPASAAGRADVAQEAVGTVEDTPSSSRDSDLRHRSSSSYDWR